MTAEVAGHRDGLLRGRSRGLLVGLRRFVGQRGMGRGLELGRGGWNRNRDLLAAVGVLARGLAAGQFILELDTVLAMRAFELDRHVDTAADGEEHSSRLVPPLSAVGSVPAIGLTAGTGGGMSRAPGGTAHGQSGGPLSRGGHSAARGAATTAAVATRGTNSRRLRLDDRPPLSNPPPAEILPPVGPRPGAGAYGGS